MRNRHLRTTAVAQILRLMPTYLPGAVVSPHARELASQHYPDSRVVFGLNAVASLRSLSRILSCSIFCLCWCLSVDMSSLILPPICVRLTSAGSYGSRLIAAAAPDATTFLTLAPRLNSSSCAPFDWTSRMAHARHIPSAILKTCDQIGCSVCSALSSSSAYSDRETLANGNGVAVMCVMTEYIAYSCAWSQHHVRVGLVDEYYIDVRDQAACTVCLHLRVNQVLEFV